MANERLAVITLPSDTGIAKDSVQMALAIKGDAAYTAASDVELALAVRDFINSDVGSPGGFGLHFLLSPVLSIAANMSEVAIYDIAGHLAGTPHGSPTYTLPFTLGPPTGGTTALPSEVAVVVTLEAVGRADAQVEVGPTRPKQRRTGRVYFGPLNTGALSIIGGVARPSLQVCNSLRHAIIRLNNLLEASVFTAGHVGVWSRADALVRTVDAVSTDDAFDTQRRRGEGATARIREVV